MGSVTASDPFVLLALGRTHPVPPPPISVTATSRDLSGGRRIKAVQSATSAERRLSATANATPPAPLVDIAPDYRKPRKGSVLRPIFANSARSWQGLDFVPTPLQFCGQPANRRNHCNHRKRGHHHGTPLPQWPLKPHSAPQFVPECISPPRNDGFLAAFRRMMAWWYTMQSK